MKLGFWNRLAVVATVLVVGVLPLALMIDLFKTLSDDVKIMHQLCMNEARDLPVNQMAAAVDKCYDEMLAGNLRARDAAYSWKGWVELASATFLACIIVYGLVWLVAAVARWVWQGRKL